MKSPVWKDASPLLGNGGSDDKDSPEKGLGRGDSQSAPPRTRATTTWSLYLEAGALLHEAKLVVQHVDELLGLVQKALDLW